MTERRTDPDILSDIQTRLAVVENDLNQIIDNRKSFIRWVLGLFGVVLIQLGSFAYGYGQITQKMTDLDLSDVTDTLVKLEGNVNTALAVLGQHGEEFKDVRNEQARVRGNLDQFHQYMNEIRAKIDTQTMDRFYKSDGDRLDRRLTRIEDWIIRAERRQNGE